ncbi:MAG: hypothetical protein ACYC35_29050 [Pirellulales bacterium]
MRKDKKPRSLLTRWPVFPAALASLAVMAVAAAAMAGEPARGKVPLVLQLPKPRFLGTPVNLKSPRLEKPRAGKRPDLAVPAGVTNVALHKPVTASDDAPTLGELSQVTDGDKDGIEGSYVEIGPGKQHFQIDLRERWEIFAVVVWHYHGQARIYHDVVVQLSDDPAFSKARTVFNNDFDNTSGFGLGKDKEYIDTHEGLLIDTRGAAARYVRLYGNGNTESDLNHCTEIEVYARKPQSPAR